MKPDRSLRLILNKIDRRESLFRSDLRNLYITCMNFTGMDLRETNFEGARLNHGTFDSSDLSNANLANTDLTNVSLQHANLTGTILRNAIVSGANFTGVKGLSAEVVNSLKSKGAKGL
ncbi:MAG: pentapeptide repeat-containing protein [Chloroflexota bacterium]|jgi:uncharacterized protein YjbI with pentapeptide repeats